MTVRRPLVLVSGAFSELPQGDSVVGSSVELLPNPSGLIVDGAALGVDGVALVSGSAAQASANQAQATANTALASGNAGIADAKTALASGNAALADLPNYLPLAGGNLQGLVTFSGTQSFPFIPQNLQSVSYVLTSGDAGKHISTTSGVTVPANVFAVGEAVSVVNTSAGTQSIFEGTGAQVILAGVGTSGTRELATYGVATVLCINSNLFVVVGAGVS